MSYAKANQAYTEAAVLSATPAQLVVILYDGCLRFLHQSSTAMRNGDLRYCREQMFRAENIINALNLSLDMNQGQIAAQLRAIYLFCKRYLAQGMMEQDPAKIEAVTRLLSELRDGWAQIAANAPAGASS